MLDGGVSKRYGRALFDIAVENDAVDAIESELHKVLDVLTSDPSIERFWNSTTAQPKEKKDVVVAFVAKAGFSTVVVNFLKLLADKGRESFLPSICAVFESLADEYRRVQDVEVGVAMEMTDSALDKLRHRLEASLGRSVRLNVKIEPELLGGIVVRIGDKVMDGSLSRRLDALKKAMIQG